MEPVLQCLGGPVFRFSIMLMALGALRLIVLTAADIRSAGRHAGDRRTGYGEAAASTLAWLAPVRELTRTRPLFSVLSVLFHAGIIIVPLFLFEHIMLVERGTGLAWPALPEMAADLLTLGTLAAGVFLLLRRIFSAPLRAVSSASDYLLTALVGAVFASGWLAGRDFSPFPRSAVMLVHLLAGNLTLVLLPFTRLSHAFIFPLARAATAAGWHVRPPVAGPVSGGTDSEGGSAS